MLQFDATVTFRADDLPAVETFGVAMGWTLRLKAENPYQPGVFDGRFVALVRRSDDSTWLLQQMLDLIDQMIDEHAVPQRSVITGLFFDSSIGYDAISDEDTLDGPVDTTLDV